MDYIPNASQESGKPCYDFYLFAFFEASQTLAKISTSMYVYLY